MLSIDNCQLKTSPIVIGSLVTHIYNLEEMWVEITEIVKIVEGVTPNGKLIWKSNEVGLVLKLDVWGDYILISVMIPAGIGHCFGSDVNVI